MSIHLRLFTILIFVLISLSTVYSQAANTSVEAYEENLSMAFSINENDTIRLSALLESLDVSNHEFAELNFKYIQKGIDLAQKENHTSWEAEFYDKLGWTHISLSQKDESEIAHEKSMELFKSDENIERQVEVIHTLIASYAINNAAEKSLKRAYEAISLCPLLDDEDSCLGMTYFFMAKTMYNFDEDEKGIGFAEKAMPLLEKSQKFKQMAKCYSDFAKYGSYDYETSLKFMDKSLAHLSRDSTTTTNDTVRLYLSRVLMHEKFDRHEEAGIDIDYLNSEFKDDMSIKRQQNLTMSKGLNKFNLGKYEECIAILKQSLVDEWADINPFSYYNYQYLEKAHKELGQADSAYYYHLILHKMESDDRVHESRMKMKDVEAKYEAEKKELTIVAQNETISKQKIIQWFGLGTTLLLGLLLFQTYRNGQQKRKANEQLVELDNLKTHLFTNITHEFRTPLTVILGMASQLKADPSRYLDSGTELIQKNGERLMDLINQMLDLNKLESGAMSLNIVQADAIKYMRYLSQSVESFAAGKQIKVHFYAEEEKVIMDYDEEKLKIIFTNLFSNSIKFTPEGGNIYIMTKKLTERKNPVLKIVFKDTGSGIEEENLPFVFDRFYQTDAGNTRTGEGTGIGLALVKEYITLMGGDISVKSKLGTETVFTILLPIKNEAPLAGKSSTHTSNPPILINKADKTFAAAPTALNSHNPTVLLVEDNLDVATYIASCLEDSYNVVIGNNGKEGVNMALQYIPDVIITDVMMPLKDGFEVCQDVKSNQLTSHIPLIMLTAKADYTSKLEGLKYGADAYLEKPFNKEELQTRLANLLSSRDKIQRYHLSLTSADSPTNNPTTVTPSAEDEFVHNLHQIVTDHISDTSFSVQSFARIVGMSSTQFHRKVSGVTGLSPNKLIRHIRLSKAKILLTESDNPISNIAYETGFNDPSYFGRVFKKEYGMTPLEWREGRI